MGNFFLAEKANCEEFTGDDEEVLAQRASHAAATGRALESSRPLLCVGPRCLVARCRLSSITLPIFRRAVTTAWSK